MIEPLLAVNGLRKNFGAITATDRVDFEVMPGEIHALIGPNGAGKTTLINQITGEIKPDAGEVIFEGRNVTRMPVHRRSLLGLARTFQITNIFSGFSATANVALAVQSRAGHSFRFWKPVHGDCDRAVAESGLDRLGVLTVRDEPGGMGVA